MTHCQVFQHQTIQLHMQITQSWDCAHMIITQFLEWLCNLKIGTQSKDSENVQHNFEIAQILLLHGTYYILQHAQLWRYRFVLQVSILSQAPTHNSDSFVVFQGPQCNYPHAIFDSQFLLTHNSYWLTIHIATEFTNSCDDIILMRFRTHYIRQQDLDTSVIASSATFFAAVMNSVDPCQQDCRFLVQYSFLHCRTSLT